MGWRTVFGRHLVHGLGKERLDQLIGVVTGLLEGVARIYPVKHDVARSLMPQFQRIWLLCRGPNVGDDVLLPKGGRRAELGPSKHQEGLMRLAEVSVLLPDYRSSGVSILEAVDGY